MPNDVITMTVKDFNLAPITGTVHERKRKAAEDARRRCIERLIRHPLYGGEGDMHRQVLNNGADAVLEATRIAIERMLRVVPTSAEFWIYDDDIALRLAADHYKIAIRKLTNRSAMMQEGLKTLPDHYNLLTCDNVTIDEWVIDHSDGLIE